VVAADLGADRLFVYRLDPATGRLSPNDPPSVASAPGAGPRHFAFHPDGRRGFAVNALDLTITAYDWDATGGTLSLRSSEPTVPEGERGEGVSTAEIEVHPSGRFVYGSNRGHDSIAVFSLDAASGSLTPVETEPTRGRAPRHFALAPGGEWLIAANQ